MKILRSNHSEKMDYVSNLPDDILCHILSFLTTNEAALTSVLSRKWRNLFALAHNLDIDFSFPPYPTKSKPIVQQRFMDYVDRVLALRGDSPIKKFSLHCIGTDSDRVDPWITNVLVRGVSELDLSFLLNTKSVEPYRLSPNCFKSKKLVKLKIGYWIDIGWLDGSTFLPMLKTIVLDYVSLSVDKFEFLLHSLPVLEELILLYVYWEYCDVADLIVSSASLKTLKIVCSGWVKTLSFDTPSLVYFSYCDFVAEDYSLVTIENLYEASISLLVATHDIERARAQNNDLLEEDNVVIRFTNVGKIMNGIRNVHHLALSANTLEVLSLCCETMPVFNNLKTLTIIKSDERRGWQAMPVLLRNCPHLETLVFEGLLHHVTDKCGDACDCVFREYKGRSLTSCPVKMIEIQRFRGTMREMHMIKHFSDYFPCLKEIKIYIEENNPMQLSVAEVSEVIAEGLLHYVTDKCGDACDCVSREDKGRSLISCPVKVLDIMRFQGTMREMHIIKHFLDYFPCLKEIKIYMGKNDFTKLKVPELFEFFAEKMELNKLSSYNIQLLVNG